MAIKRKQAACSEWLLVVLLGGRVVQRDDLIPILHVLL